jgi:DNA repair protein RadC
MSFAYRLETRRIKESDFPYDARRTLNSPETIVIFAQELQNSDIEKMMVIYLDRKHHLLGITLQAGSISGSVVYPREIAKHALLCGAANVVLVHNHPSGDPATSLEDKNLTTTIENALALLDIGLLDHIIIGIDGKYFSYTETGILKPTQASGQLRLT